MLSLLGALAPALLATGCSLRLDMHVQPKIKTLRESTFWGDNRGSRPLVEGTVARGELREDKYFYTGKMGDQPGTVMPFPVDKEVLARGQQRFNVYCSPCHGYVGDGNGMIVQRGFQRPPSYMEPRLMNAPIGHFFDVMTHGYGKMPDYAAQVAPVDRWKIAAYIRALQLSQHAPIADVPAGVKVPEEGPTERLPKSSGTGRIEQTGTER